VQRELEQRRGALVMANDKRAQVAALRRGARAGTVSVPSLLMDPPAALGHIAVIDVMLMSRASIPSQAYRRKAKLGRWAVADGVNLLVALGDASERTRQWAAKYAPPPTRKQERA
jgi:hypothetical protein